MLLLVFHFLSRLTQLNVVIDLLLFHMCICRIPTAPSESIYLPLLTIASLGTTLLTMTFIIRETQKPSFVYSCPAITLCRHKSLCSSSKASTILGAELGQFADLLLSPQVHPNPSLSFSSWKKRNFSDLFHLFYLLFFWLHFLSTSYIHLGAHYLFHIYIYKD